MLIVDDRDETLYINLRNVTSIWRLKNYERYCVRTADCEEQEIDRETYDRIVAWMEANE